MQLIADFLARAEAQGARTAVVSGAGEAVSFAALARRSAGLARAWRAAGLAPGDRVLVALPVGIELYAAIAGLWRCGATIVFPEPALGLAGVAHAIQATRPRAFLAGSAYRLLRLVMFGRRRVRLHLALRPRAGREDPLAALTDDHPALISFTSGSTGAPKGIVRSAGFLAAQNACLDDLLAPTREDETDLVAFPVFVVANLGRGVTSVLPDWRMTRHDRASAEGIARLVTARRVTRALLPPSVCEVISRGKPAPALHAIFTGGGPVFPDLLARLGDRLPGAELVSVYGSTEAEPIAHQRAAAISAADWRRMTGGEGLLAGPPVAAARTRIRDGEIVVTGPHVNKGYLDGRGDGENKLNLDGEIWHCTGDAGRLESDGRLWLRGRRAGAAGGLYPFEAEAVARSWPGVRAAALLPESVPPILALAGAEPQAGRWQALSDSSIGARIFTLPAIPTDRRHRSKVDVARLRTLVVTR